jgi:DNA helicase-4
MKLLGDIRQGRFADLSEFLFLDDLILSKDGSEPSDYVGLKRPRPFHKATTRFVQRSSEAGFLHEFNQYKLRLKIESKSRQEAIDRRKAEQVKALNKAEELARIRKQDAQRETERRESLRNELLKAEERARLEMQAQEEAEIQAKILAKATEERQRQEKINLVKSIKQYFPEYWSCDAIVFSNATGLAVTDCDLREAKIQLVRDWFDNHHLDIPSVEQSEVICDCSHSLRVVARAGSGKTRTIAQKIIFLVHYLGYRPDEILALAFNNKASKELEERIYKFQDAAHLPTRGTFKVLTFDALAYNIVRPKETVLVDYGQNKLIKELVFNAIENEEGMRKQVEELMVNSFRGDWDKILRLNTISSLEDLARLRSFMTEESIDGKEVKSKPEKRIADFLFEHGIPYSYEMPFTVYDGNIIRPDFYLKAHKLVIEYYGLRGDSDYERIISYKRRYWSKRKDITVIEIDPGFICKRGCTFDDGRENDYQALSKLLFERTTHLQNQIQPQRLSDEEILVKLRDRITLRFSELLQSAITRAGQMNCSEAELMEKISRYEASKEEKNFLDLVPKFLTMYHDHLGQNRQTDFNEIKKKAIKSIYKGITALAWDAGKNCINLQELRFVFVDEFQDFSELFRNLLLAILRVASKPLVNAVGDDWQMINRYAGSKPELFDQFSNDYSNPKTVYLQTNYRSAGGIVDFCNAIMNSNGFANMPAIACDSLKKSQFRIACLELDKILLAPREEYLFHGDQILTSVFRLFPTIADQFRPESKKKGDRICFAVSRTNDPLVQVKPEELAISATNNRELLNGVFRRWSPSGVCDFFEAITSHKSKGLEADAVIMLQPLQYPTIRQRSMFLQFFGDTPANLLRDELNLFYVACSRAKHHLYFLPKRSHMMSPFLCQIKSSISNMNWDSFPCRITFPKELHIVSVQNCNQTSNVLFDVTDILIAHGFDKFHRPNRIPTRSLTLRKGYFDALVFMEKLVNELLEYQLKFIIKDGLNRQIFCLPGPKSIKQALAECTSEQ